MEEIELKAPSKWTSRKLLIAVAACVYFAATGHPDWVFWLVNVYLGANAVSHLAK